MSLQWTGQSGLCITRPYRATVHPSYFPILSFCSCHSSRSIYPQRSSQCSRPPPSICLGSINKATLCRRQLLKAVTLLQIFVSFMFVHKDQGCSELFKIVICQMKSFICSYFPVLIFPCALQKCSV